MSDQDREPRLLHRLSGSTNANKTQPGWTQEVSARVVVLVDRLEHVESEHRNQVEGLIEAAAKFILDSRPKGRWRRRVSDWWNGTPVEEAWAYLHEAELQIVEFSDERGLALALEDALTRAELLDATDPVRIRFEEYVKHRATWAPTWSELALRYSAPSQEQEPRRDLENE